MPEPLQLNKRRTLFNIKSPRSMLPIILGVIVVVLGVFVAAYQWSLSPRDAGSTDEIRVVVTPGETVVDIARNLKKYDLIRSETSFRIYSELTNTKNRLQAGGYALTKSMSVADIIDHMSTGMTDEFNVQIAPGLTLKQQYDKSIVSSFAQQGFSESEIKEAFETTYDYDFLAKRPRGATLEGYIFPETYRIAADSDLKMVIKKSLDEFARVIEENDIENGLKKRGLSLHEGITLASIIQKEVADEKDQRQVAQVFLKRLKIDMALQSDPTFIYAARQDGAEPSVGYDSPYNTYQNKGLPPGPIANFNLSALLAVINPAKGEYVYFVADENGVTHYTVELSDHEANVKRYCTDHCNDF